MGPTAGTSAFVYASEELGLYGFRPANTSGASLSLADVRTLDDLRAELFLTSSQHKKLLGLGILTEPNRPSRVPFLFLRPPALGSFIGVLWLDNDILGASGWNWVLEVYGRGHLERINRFAERLRRSLHVAIDVRVTRERALPEKNPPFRLFQGLEEI